MKIGEFPGRRGRGRGCWLYRPRRKGGEGIPVAVGMLRGLRVDARCLATFPQHPSWTTAAIDDFHDHCCRRCCASAIIQDRYLIPTSRSLDSWSPSTCVCVFFFKAESCNLIIYRSKSKSVQSKSRNCQSSKYKTKTKSLNFDKLFFLS